MRQSVPISARVLAACVIHSLNEPLLSLNPLTNVGFCATGGAAAMLIPAVGTHGLDAHSEL